MKPFVKASVVVGALIVLALAWWLLSPLWRTVEVSEASPLAAESRSDAIVARGSFVNGAHDVSGDALLITNEGKQTLRLEHFETLNGPDLRLYLATDTSASDFVDLGELKATKGDINYDVPAGVDTSRYDTVLVWCRAFSVNFGSATLS